MTTKTEGLHTAEFIVSEANAFRSRGTGTVTVPDGGMASGTILGGPVSDKYVRHDADASDGSEDEAGVLFAPQINDTGSAVDVTATIILRDAEVNGDDLTYEDGADGNQITTSNTALAALGIIVR